MPRGKKVEVDGSKILEEQAPDNAEHLRIVFTAAALAGLIARGTGQSIEMVCQSAMTYADAMMEKYK